MVLSRRIILKGVLILAGLALAGAVGAVLFAYSGLYNVAASRGHPLWLNWFLETGMRRSVQFHSSDAPTPDLTDPDLIALGAAHFQGGCAPCHGAPGQPINPVYEHMLPSPPSLSGHVPRWEDRELFWIVEHGLQYAGMPAWSGKNRRDEVWAVTAFLRKLPEIDTETYQRLARGNAEIERASAAQFVNTGRSALHLTACARCHEHDAAPSSGLVPRLAGQPQAYLKRALNEYRHNKRQSGIMEPVAASLDETQIAKLAGYYASLPAPPANNAPPGKVSAGRRIALEGDPKRGLPPCESCHGADALADYPRLAGQSVQYVVSQLELWRRGGRAQTPQGELMAEIAERMSDEQIDAVADFYAGGGEQ